MVQAYNSKSLGSPYASSHFYYTPPDIAPVLELPLSADAAMEPKSWPHPGVQRAPTQKQRPMAKLAIGAAVTMVNEVAGGHYLEFLKVAKQCAPPRTTYAQITRDMIGAKGLSGVLDGFLPWGGIMSLLKGASFSFGQAYARNLLNGRMSDRKRDIISGGIGGFVQGVVMNPALLLKTRVMTDARFRAAAPIPVVAGAGQVAAKPPSTSLLFTARMSWLLGFEIIQKEGINTLMKGVSVFSFKRFCDWTTRYAFVDALEIGVKRSKGLDDNHRLPRSVRMLCALGGGIASATCTLPIDVAVARIQDAKKAGKDVRIGDLVREMRGREGWAMATRGFAPRALKVATTTLLMKNVCDAVYDSIYDTQHA